MIGSRVLVGDYSLPRPPKYVESLPFGLDLGVLGHDFTYFGGSGSGYTGSYD